VTALDAAALAVGLLVNLAGWALVARAAATHTGPGAGVALMAAGALLAVLGLTGAAGALTAADLLGVARA
jgi:hypothetical protein